MKSLFTQILQVQIYSMHNHIHSISLYVIGRMKMRKNVPHLYPSIISNLFKRKTNFYCFESQ